MKNKIIGIISVCILLLSVVGALAEIQIPDGKIVVDNTIYQRDILQHLSWWDKVKQMLGVDSLATIEGLDGKTYICSEQADKSMTVNTIDNQQKLEIQMKSDSLHKGDMVQVWRVDPWSALHLNQAGQRNILANGWGMALRPGENDYFQVDPNTQYELSVYNCDYPQSLGSCTDSDGWDMTTSGYVNSGENTFRDYCKDSNTAVDFYCGETNNDAKPLSTEYNCREYGYSGCSNGKCVLDCSYKWLDNTECRGADLYKQYQYGDCTTTMKKFDSNNAGCVALVSSNNEIKSDSNGNYDNNNIEYTSDNIVKDGDIINGTINDVKKPFVKYFEVDKHLLKAVIKGKVNLPDSQKYYVEAGIKNADGQLLTMIQSSSSACDDDKHFAGEFVQGEGETMFELSPSLELKKGNYEVSVGIFNGCANELGDNFKAYDFQKAVFELDNKDNFIVAGNSTLNYLFGSVIKLVAVLLIIGGFLGWRYM